MVVSKCDSEARGKWSEWDASHITELTQVGNRVSLAVQRVACSTDLQEMTGVTTLMLPAVVYAVNTTPRCNKFWFLLCRSSRITHRNIISERWNVIQLLSHVWHFQSTNSHRNIATLNLEFSIEHKYNPSHEMRNWSFLIFYWYYFCCNSICERL